MKNALGVYGFVRYLGPHNGGCTEQNKGEYAALLKVFLASPSLRWFMDTYLTQSNIRDLLGENSPEITQLKNQWYCLRLTGCAQDNSHFPVLVWIKKQRFWKEARLEDGLFLTMKDSMLTAPVLVNNAEDTLRGPWQRQRKPPGIDLYCTKTNGCAFVSKHKKTMEDHVKKCRPKVTQLVCKTQGCKFVTPYKSALTNHKKKCDQPGAQPEIVAPDLTTTQVMVYACSHTGCKMTYTTKRQILAHQRTHAIPNSRSKAASKSEDDEEDSTEETDGKMTNPTRRQNTAHQRTHSRINHKANAKPNRRAKATSKPEADEDSDDGKQQKATREKKPVESKEPPTVPVTKLFRCAFCEESHDTTELAQRHQRKHLEPTSSSLAGMYRCLECPKSHNSPELARLHQQKHQTRQQRSTVDVETLMCPECKVFSGTPVHVLAHVGGCRASLTCSLCHIKCDSQSLLMIHLVLCARGEPATARNKRPREDEEESWKPNRNHNKKNMVKLHWQRSDVAVWLRLVELEEYQAKFTKEQVDGRILLALTEESIKGPQYGMTAPHAAKFIELREAFE
jgi:hypothetical protein